MLSTLSNERAANRLATTANHLLETRIRVDPGTKNVNLQFSWADAAGDVQQSYSAPQPQSNSQSQAQEVPAESAPAQKGDRTAAQLEEEKLPPTETKAKGQAKGEYTVEEVAKHNKEEDCWVIIDGQVLDVTNFLQDHPGGAKAILLYAGRDATEEYSLIHPEGAIAKYASHTGKPSCPTHD